MGNNGKSAAISQHVLEIRFKPNAKVLDYRGSWAELISIELGLSEWQIFENRVDIHDIPRKEIAFVGYRNAGFTCYDVPTTNYFPDKALKFLKYLFSLDGFGNPIFAERIGVRYKFITPYLKGFDDLRERYITRFIVLTEKSKEAIDAKLIDVGGALNFVDKLGNFNTKSGPMAQEQMRQFIDRKGDYPEVGLYFDIDYWTKPNKNMNITEVSRVVKALATECWNRHDKICRLICEE